MRTRAFVTVLAIELPITYRNGIPFGMARVTREASTIAVVNTTTVSRQLRSRLTLPQAPRKRARRVTVRLSAHRGLLLRPQNLQLQGLFHSDGGSSLRSISLDQNALLNLGST